MKRQHPIRKMQRALSVKSPYLWPEESEKTIACHVKPLLDALALEHKGWPEAHFGLRCKTCDLLAEWRKPL